MEFNLWKEIYDKCKLIIFKITNQFKVELIFLFERYLLNEAKLKEFKIVNTKLKLEHFPSIHRLFSTGADH